MIEDRYDSERGCGWRKSGGIYLIGGNLMASCGKLPIPLTVCPCCHAGIKPTRGFTWVGSALVINSPCRNKTCGIPCRNCPPFDGSQEKLGLIWVGGSFYPTPEAFMREAREQGISRRIPAVPKDFIVGESWVLLAHREGMPNPDKPRPAASGDEYTAFPNDPDVPDYVPAIFSAFLPRSIEYVVDGTETEKDIEAMEKRGLTCVRVHKTAEATAFTTVGFPDGVITDQDDD